MQVKKSIFDNLFDSLNYFIMILVLLAMIVPFLYIFNYSVSNPYSITGSILIWPNGFNVDAYRVATSDPAIINGFFISVSRTVIGTALMLLLTSMAGYAVTRDDVFGVTFARKLFVFSMYLIPGIIPTYLLIKELHLIGTFWVYVIPTAVSIFNLILVKTYIESLPKGLEEAALIDGANELHLFFRILFPLCLPILVAISLFTGVMQWNQFVDTQFYNAMNPDLYPLQYVLYMKLQSTLSIEEAMRGGARLNTQNITSQSLKMAMTIVTILPILVVYPFLQKYFIKGLLVGAIKG